MTSRLHIWMKPVPEEWKTRSDNNKLDTMGDFKVWADSTMPEDPRLLVTIGGSANIAVQHKQLLYGDGDPNCSQQGAPNYVLIEKKSFCRKIDSTDYLRCHKVKSPPFSSSMGSSRGSSISTSSSVGSADIVEAVMNMKIGTWKNPTTGTKKQPLITCGFCYIQYKRHCQKLGKPYPMVTDPGFWIGHSAKDENGDVTCPELFKLVCPLCFATGKKAHTLKFCPLMSMARTRYHNNNYN